MYQYRSSTFITTWLLIISFYFDAIAQSGNRYGIFPNKGVYYYYYYYYFYSAFLLYLQDISELLNLYARHIENATVVTFCTCQTIGNRTMKFLLSLILLRLGTVYDLYTADILSRLKAAQTRDYLLTRVGLIKKPRFPLRWFSIKIYLSFCSNLLNFHYNKIYCRK
jgi:hypothetical protein